MSNIIITVGAITSAVRLEKKLNSLGDVKASVIHTPTEINKGGCSYSVKTTLNKLPLIEEIIAENRIKIKKVYIEDIINGESAYRDLS